MATISPSMHKVTILPEGGRDFLRRRLMEIVGLVIAAFGVMLLMAIFTFSNSDPSLNHATGTPPNNLLGLRVVTVEGEILAEPRGTGGFGYDPLFYLPELKKTMAEVDLETKNRLSHRGKAFFKLLQEMRRNPL